MLLRYFFFGGGGACAGGRTIYGGSDQSTSLTTRRNIVKQLWELSHCFTGAAASAYYRPLFGQHAPVFHPTKELTKGGDLRSAQVDDPWSVEPFLRFKASLGSITDALYYTADYDYANVL